MKKFFLVTGGCGFLGSALVRRLLLAGYRVRVFDNQFRGSLSRIEDIAERIEYQEGDIRDPAAVARAVQGVDAVCHMAAINGTANFYAMPELVLEVGVKGMLNVIDACIASGVGELSLASSSEVYHYAAVIPTPENVPLVIPDPLNPRYSYAASKLISEVLAFGFGRKHFRKLLVFRPHNVYGPHMGWEHVIPQFVIRMKQLEAAGPGPYRFPIQGDGSETRSFVFVDDFIEGLLIVLERGEHLNTYHIGREEEVSMAVVAGMVADYFGEQIELVAGKPAAGGAARRCPDIAKLSALGYCPRVSLREGLAVTARWYSEHSGDAPQGVRSMAGEKS